MQIVPAVAADLDEAGALLTEAFAVDPLIDYFFESVPERRQQAAREFFGLLLQARIELAMPVLLARDAGRLLGVAMGYTSERPDWPALLNARWAALEASTPGMADRSAAYTLISDRGLPGAAHYYLGVLGVRPGAQGRGVGSTLLQAFCALSEADPLSRGTYLETANPANLPLYGREGFVQTSAGSLGSASLWCMFRPHGPQN